MALWASPSSGIAIEQEEEHDEGWIQMIPSAQTHERIGFHGYEASPAFVVIDCGKQVTPEKLVLFPARLPHVASGEGNGFPSALRVEISEAPDFSRSIRILQWREENPGSGERLPFLSLDGNGASGRFVRIVVEGFRQPTDKFSRAYFRLGEVVVLENGHNVALKAPVETSEGFENPRRWEAMNITDGYFWCLPLRGEPGSPSDGFRSLNRASEKVEEEAWVEVDLGRKYEVDEIHLVPSNPLRYADSFGYGFPPRFWLLADAGTPDEVEIIREVDPPYPAVALPNPGEAQVTVATPGLQARKIRLRCETLWRRGFQGDRKRNAFLFSLSEIQIWNDGINLAEGSPVRASDSEEGERWSASALTDGYSSRHELLSWNQWIEAIERSAKQAQQREFESLQAQIQREKLVSRLVFGAACLVVFVVLFAIIAVLFFKHREELRQEELRARIARDLHDEIGASLSHLAMQSDLARAEAGRGLSSGNRLSAISMTARETLDHMRDVIWLLAPGSGSWREFSERLESIASRLLDDTQSKIVVEGAPPAGAPPIEWAREVVSFLKEALTNARKHSGSDELSVTICWDRSLTLKIEDDGVGFDPNHREAAGGAGLGNMRIRAQNIGAEFFIRSQPGAGCTVELRAPRPDL